MKLSQFIRENRDELINDWEQFAASICGTHRMNKQELQDHAQQMLETVIRQIDEPNSQPIDNERTDRKHPGTVDSNAAGEAHASSRLEHGFTLYQIMAEFRALRAAVLRLWLCHKNELDDTELEQLINFNDGIDHVLMESVSAYSEELDRSRQVFLGVLGHDLRNPLNAMMMCATLIRHDSEAGSRQSRCASTILRSGEKIEHILGDLLDLARSRLGGNIPLNRRPLNLCNLCEEAIAELKIAHSQTEFQLHCKGDINGYWDEMRINQLLWNLSGNAVKHGGPNTPVTITARGDHDNVIIQVHNEGAAIPEASQQAIFDPLVALKSQDQARVTESGIGLGLYICRLIAEAHGGRIDVSSSEEEGTSFSVILPKKAPPERQQERRK